MRTLLLCAVPMCLPAVAAVAEGDEGGQAGPVSRKALAARVRPFIDRHELAGAVMLVADKARVLYVEAAGWADIDARRPMRTDSVFWIASQSKCITAAALMVLADEEKLKVDDPVEKYLPEFKGQMVVAERDAEHVLLRRPKHPITIRNVLTHTSGLPFRSALEVPTLDGLSLSVCAGSYAMTPLDFEPDSQYRYSNAGINTAGRIVEVLAKIPFEEFLAKRLFGPLGMKDTTFWPSEAQATRIATSYKPGPGGKALAATTIGQLRYPLTDRRGRFPMPAGGLFSTAHDVARFYRMLLNGGQLDGRRYLSESAVKQMTSRQTPTGLKQSYGFGLAVGGDFFGHGGAYSTNTSADTRRGLILVWLVQHAGFPGRGGQAQGAFCKAAIDAFAPPGQVGQTTAGRHCNEQDQQPQRGR